MTKREETLNIRIREINMSIEVLGEFSETNEVFALKNELHNIRKEILRIHKAQARRAAITDVYDSLGMTKVRGNLGGIYYE
jgi:hypothetical protein